jgi:excinuclease ABC subunit A
LVGTFTSIEHIASPLGRLAGFIDLGPEGGGGEIVAAGTPEQVVKEKRSYTGQFLKPVLARKAAGKRRVEAAE